MKIMCEMFISELFFLSSGHIAIVGKVTPNVKYYIPDDSIADLYVSGKKIKTIQIIGEDRFSGVDEEKPQGRRSLRTNSDIPKNLSGLPDVKLVIFDEKFEN